MYCNLHRFPVSEIPPGIMIARLFLGAVGLALATALVALTVLPETKDRAID
jgi:hypothetical protein